MALPREGRVSCCWVVAASACGAWAAALLLQFLLLAFIAPRLGEAPAGWWDTPPVLPVEVGRGHGNGTELGCEVPEGATVAWTKTEPPFRIAVYRDGDIVSAAILARGVWEEEVGAAIASQLARASGGQPLFVDVGANLGYHSLHMANMGARVMAFEPMQRNVELLRASVCLNGLQDMVDVYPVALGTEVRHCAVAAPEGNSGDGVLTCSGGGGDVVVAVDRLERYVKGKRIDALKIDVEGWEQGAIEGGIPAWRGGVEQVFPLYTIFECNGELARRRGYGTIFWLALAREFGCTFDLGVEHDAAVLGWVAGVPLVPEAVLAACGGANLAMSCRSGRPPWFPVRAIMLQLHGLVVVAVVLAVCYPGPRSWGRRPRARGGGGR